MAKPLTVFYAWEADLPQKTNRWLIKQAALAAIKHLGTDEEWPFEDAPELDHDTKNTPGWPVIIDTVLNKINNCDIFLADVSFVTESHTVAAGARKGGKRLSPNPNVLIELGYALKRLSFERIVLVFNSAYGAVDGLPFDMGNRRRPIEFHLAADASSSAITAESEKLSKAIGQALKSISLHATSPRVDESTRRRVANIVKDPSREVAKGGDLLPEYYMISGSVYRGIYLAIKDVSIDTVAKTVEERAGLEPFPDLYREYLKRCDDLVAYGVAFVRDQLPPQRVVPFCKIILYYACLVVGGIPEDEAMKDTKNHGISHDGSECKTVGAQLMGDDEFKRLHAAVLRASSACRATLDPILDSLRVV